MKRIIISWLVGTSVVAFADTSLVQVVKTGAGTVICNTTVGYGSITAGGRCFSGYVMTGISSLDPLQIRCAPITVSCTSTATPKSTPTPLFDAQD